MEGFVNQYLFEQGTLDSSIFKFVSESIENFHPGQQTRTMLEINSGHHFRETFELAGPENAWDCYITIDFQRVT
jgi:hypothetical protein